MKKVTSSLLALVVVGLILQTATADFPGDTMEAAIHELQSEWALIKYGMPNDQQKARFKTLSKRAHAVSERYFGQADPLIWEAIILSSYADTGGGLKALKAVKKARKLLQVAESIDPFALDGSIYTTLGSLYYQVPAWPIAFGSDRKARQYLEKAVQINPKDIDANYFYGGFLIKKGEYEQAVEMLETALAAKPRPGRPVADAGRRQEIRAALVKAQSRL